MTNNAEFLNNLVLSDTKKRANDYALAKQYLSYIDITNNDTSKIRKYDENYDLHSGRWRAIQDVSNNLNISIGPEEFSIGSGKLFHYPIIDRVSKSLVSDLIMRPLIPNIKDNSSKARNFRETVQVERVQKFFNNTVIQPSLQKITAEYDMSNNYTDLYSLSVEQQQQRQSDIQRRFQEETPEEILKAMEKLRTPDELIAYALLNEGLRLNNAKTNFDIGAENAVVTAEEYYRLGILNSLPYLEVLNPKYVIWSGSEHTEFAEDGQFAKYTQYLTPEDAMTKYARSLMKADIQKISDLYSAIPKEYKGDYDSKVDDQIERRLVDFLEENPEINANLNIKTLEGQNKLKYLYSNLMSSHQRGYGIRESYVTWRWMRKVKFVYRYVNGDLEMYIRDEHYVKDPQAGDVKIEDRVIPQAWEGTLLGNDLYVDVGPRPYQYSSITNPWDVKIGIYGCKYNTFQNNAKNASFVDLGKPWQLKYNTLMKKMDEHLATDLGQILLGTTTMLPKGWTWSQWYKSLFLTNIAIISTHKDGVNPLDVNAIKGINLSKANDIGQDINQLTYFENKIISSMYYSPQKIGQISQYSTNQNAQLNIQGVDRQVYRFFNKNREIKERVLNGFLQLCFYAYKDNEEVKSTILSDFLKAHYELNFNNTDFSNFMLSVVDDFKETEKLEQMRSLALTYLQNGLNIKQVSKIMQSNSMAEIDDVIDDMEKEMAKKEELAYQREKSLAEEARMTSENQLRLQQEFIVNENNKDRTLKLRTAELAAQQLERANDINKNNINDAMERTEKEITSKEKIAKWEMDNKLKIEDKKAKATKSPKV